MLDDTLIYYIIGDNGASAEGTPTARSTRCSSLNGAAALETLEFMSVHIDEFGGPEAYNHYAVGWSHAMCTPYQWTKQVASHFGGTRNGTIVHWPNGFDAQGEVRSQFHHVIDIAATVLDVAGLPEPTVVTASTRCRSTASTALRFDEDDAAEHRETQYFEMFCNRGIYHKGWTAVTRHSIPWMFGATLPALDDDVWELYDTHHRLDPGPRPRSRTPRQARRTPTTVPHRGASSTTCSRSMIGASNGSTPRSPDVPNCSRALATAVRRYGAAQRELGHQPQEQVALGHRRRRGPRRRRQRRHHRPRRRVRRLVAVPERRRADPLLQPAGLAGSKAPAPSTDRRAHQVRMEFTYDGGGLGKGGESSCSSTAPGRLGPLSRRAFPMPFSADETSTSGRTPVPRSATTTTPTPADSPARSTGSSSTSTKRPRTPTTISRPKNASASQWHGSRRSRPATSRARPAREEGFPGPRVHWRCCWDRRGDASCQPLLLVSD